MYTVWGNTTPQLVSTITYQEGNGTGSPINAFNFAYTYNTSTPPPYQTFKNFVSTISGFGRLFSFTYNNITAPSGIGFPPGLTRAFLTNITDADCNTPINYTFSYNNATALPDSTTLGLDLWGYYNGAANTSLRPDIQINPSTPGYERYHTLMDDNPNSIYTFSINALGNRLVNSTNVSIGTLNRIDYATGGYTTIVYEPNDYVDPITSGVPMGNGLRVRQIINNDGLTANTITTNYSYLDPATGISSGKPISLPVFAFTQPYTSTESDAVKWTKSTVISWSDLSSEDHTIVYGSVKESRTGAGSTLYTNNIPVTNWDNSAPTGMLAWAPTVNYTGSPSGAAIGFLINDIKTYPFLMNTNYDFERGLVASIKNYDESGNEVSESAYTYQTPQTPVNITGFAYDISGSTVEAYGKYTIYTSAGPLTTQVVNKVYSLTNTSAYKQTTQSFAYNGLLHKQLTQQTTTNSDGTVYNTYIKYVKDYVITTPGDAMTQALVNLQQTTANVNTPVEEYTQVTPSGSSATTVSANLLLYNTFTPSKPGGGTASLTLPSQRLTIANPGGLTFTPSSISTSSPNTFVYDNAAGHYTVVENSLDYDYSGYLLSGDNGFKHVSTMLTDHNSFQPVAMIDNARFNEIAFSDFDSKIPSAINFTGTTTLTSTSRSGQNANSLAAGVTLTNTNVTRNTLAANYIISAWINCSGTAGTISATITAGTQSGSGSMPYAVTTNPALFPTGWQYCEFKVPISAITASTMSITISCSTAVIIDDVWAYPDVAKVSSYAYDPTAFFRTAATNTNGVASYYSYDKFGRLLFAFDQDKNIVQRKIYASAANESNFTAPAITGSATAYNNVSANWGMSAPTYNSCITASGVTYTWNFGDGTAPVVTTSTSAVPHTYLTNGSYTLSLSVSSPVYGSKATSLSITVTNLPNTNITYTNSTTGSSIASVVFKQHSTGTTIYTLTTTQLAAGYNITPDIYDITINPTGPHYTGSGSGYQTVSFNYGPTTNCFTYTGSAFVANNTDLRYQPTASFGMYTTTVCP